ncbi:beta-N-acetylhexosaminidase [Nitrospina watsonii]|uniref:beta-N-acetylhexosaminidase n=1 Tax=Nitrospina watsonii TaxID=1323948 RepID=UPI0024906BAE|nr:beta-N-acetylhexosaminidase [Nitrospina watsonii]
MKPQLSLREQTGQMLLAGFDGTTVTRETEDLILNHHVGGFILFDRNYENPQQLHALTRDLQQVAAASASGLPLFISVDQEGGRVARLKAPFTEFPPALGLDRTRSEDLAYEFGRALTRELHDVGVNMDYAPVLDVHTNPGNPVIGNRAFSTDPHWAGVLATAFMRGCRDSGVVPVGKHFPGHGDTHLDSHHDLPWVSRDVASLQTIELEPFAHAIQNGLEAIMTAHVMYPAWDDRLPATFSRPILHNILRGQMGFKGVLISDDLEMKAVEHHFPFDSFAERAVEAGLDMLLICHHRDKVLALHEQLIKGIEGGDIATGPVERSVERILHLKSKLSPFPERPPEPAGWTSYHQPVADRLRQASEYPS